MSRSRKQGLSFSDELFKLLEIAPPWLGPVIAGFVFVVLRWGTPAILRAFSPADAMRSTVLPILANIASQAAPLLGTGILLVWALAELKKRIRGKRLDSQEGIESIRSLDWREFELLLAEVYRREGFDVETAGGPGPDGGIDLLLRKGNSTVLVQCKHWKTRQVGVKVVRELLGVVSSDGARSGILVTSGTFTPEAVLFAEQNPIVLVDGRKLVELVQAVQSNPRGPRALGSPPAAEVEPSCPACAAPMALRTAKRGANAGDQFWGCSRYPACRGTRQKA